MRIKIVPSKQKNQDLLLVVNSEVITWRDLEQLIFLSIAVEETNRGKYPLRKRIKKITETLKIIPMKNGVRVETGDLE